MVDGERAMQHWRLLEGSREHEMAALLGNGGKGRRGLWISKPIPLARMQ